MVISNLDGSYQKLLVAPFGLKAGILRLIDEEIAKGSNGRITIKANSLTEREIIDKLSEASGAGVRIQLILRGICCLLPGIRGKTENINITSVVGRFLEHSRIYCFGQGENSKIYISSADLMTRNATRRVEVACPVLDADVKRQLMEILDIMLADNVKSRVLNPDGSYKRSPLPTKPVWTAKNGLWKTAFSAHIPLPVRMLGIACFIEQEKNYLKYSSSAKIICNKRAQPKGAMDAPQNLLYQYAFAKYVSAFAGLPQ